MNKYLRLIRIEQYIKNLFVFAPLFFGKEFLNLAMATNVLFAFVCFCLASSSIYIFNDIQDVNEDKLHPEKIKRPIAAGEIELKIAYLFMIFLLLSSLAISFFVNQNLLFVVVSYVILNIFYSKWLKHIAILDINIISIGFVLRILAGTAVTLIIPSIWILLITYLLALFLAIAKRRTEVVLSNNGYEVRKNINGYNLQFIDSVLAILSSIIIVCYIFYCMSPENRLHYNSNLLYLSVIFVINGIFRYLKLALVDQNTSSPTKIVLKDRFIQITIFGWLLLMSFLLYFNK